jgi:DNA repair exonuclease SbcCD ATPase subunit
VNDQTMPDAGLPMVAGLSLPTVMERFTDRAAIDKVIGEIAKVARAHVPDITTTKGREAIRSLAYNVARTKTAIDDAGKALGEDYRKRLKGIDDHRKLVRDALDALKDEVRKPLTDWENAEQARVRAIEDRRKEIQRITLSPRSTSTEIATEIARVTGFYTGFDFQEQGDLAEREFAAVMARLQDAKAAAEEREAREAELERARAEQERMRAEMDRVRREQEAAAAAEAARVRAQLEQAAREADEARAAAAAAQREADEQRRLREEVERAQAQAAQIMEAARAEAAKPEPSVPALEAQVREIVAPAPGAADVVVEQVPVASRATVREAILQAIRGKSLSQIADAILDGQVPHVTAAWRA